jgi:catechol 2,3-dioxygenase-like lactoylglutathione lyase family enzyme
LTAGAGPNRRRLVAASLALATAPGRGRAWAAPNTSTIGGWREAVLIVPDLTAWTETLTVVGGWEVAVRGAPDTSLNAFWSLPPGAQTEQVLMRNIGARTGFLRLVKATGVVQTQMRPDDQAWETGGVQALDLRVVDMEATRAALHKRGWRAPSAPVRYKTYGVEVIEWAPSSPDGVRLSLIQRIAPPLQGWSELKRWSRAANAAITVKNMASAQAFFGGALGLKPGFSSNTIGGDGPNVMGLPWALARTLPIDIQGYASFADGDGAIELISMPGAGGRDFSSEARPPNLGIAALRFMVADAAAVAERLVKAGQTLAAPPQELHLAPYGPCRAFAVWGSDGAWLEFIQPVAA